MMNSLSTSAVVVCQYQPGETTKPLLITKGAPEAILARTVAAEVDGLAHPLDEARLQRINALQERYNRQGYRLLAVAARILPVGQHAPSAKRRIGSDVDRILRFYRSREV